MCWGETAEWSSLIVKCIEIDTVMNKRIVKPSIYQAIN